MTNGERSDRHFQRACNSRAEHGLATGLWLPSVLIADVTQVAIHRRRRQPGRSPIRIVGPTRSRPPGARLG